MATGASMATTATLPSTAKSFLHHSPSPSPSPSSVTFRFHFLQHSPLRCTSSSFISPLFHPSFLAKPRRNRRSSTSIVMSMEAGTGVMGTKLGMMSYFEENDTIVPVTVVGFRKGNIVTQLKTEATDGYNSVQVGYRRVRDRILTKPEMGHLKKSGIIPLRHL